MEMITGKQRESDAFTFYQGFWFFWSFPGLIDTFARFGPLLQDVLLEAAWQGMYRPHWSDGILAELERNLRKKDWNEARSII